MKHHVAGIGKVWTSDETNSVVWSSNWPAVIEAANDPSDARFTAICLGSETFGHVNVYYEPQTESRATRPEDRDVVNAAINARKPQMFRLAVDVKLDGAFRFVGFSRDTDATVREWTSREEAQQVADELTERMNREQSKTPEYRTEYRYTPEFFSY